MAPSPTITLSSRSNKKLKRDGAKPTKSIKEKLDASTKKRSVSFVEKDAKGKGKETARAPTPPPSKKQKLAATKPTSTIENAAELEEPLTDGLDDHAGLEAAPSEHDRGRDVW